MLFHVMCLKFEKTAKKKPSVGRGGEGDDDEGDVTTMTRIFIRSIIDISMTLYLYDNNFR
jgi:hypothetical protein